MTKQAKYKNLKLKDQRGENASIFEAADLPRATKGFCIVCDDNVVSHNGHGVEPHVEHLKGEGLSCPLASKRGSRKAA
jgi:competence CoiA-like predicted nuclease